jgi:hypothetical protein
MNLPKLRVVVLTIMMMAMAVPYSTAQIFSDNDTLSVIGVNGIPGDTVSVSFNLFNNFYAGGFQLRITYDPNTFSPISMNLTERDRLFDLYGADFSHPGIIAYFATSWDPMEASIHPGSGSIVDLLLAIRTQAVPDSYLIKFENADSTMYQNALSSIGGDSLIIPILEGRSVVVNPGSGVAGEDILPRAIALEQNYPNPFNGSTAISFSLDKPESVELSIFNILGEKVITLFSGPMAAGNAVIIWNGTDDRGQTQASGIYLYRLKVAGGNMFTKKMTLMK